MQVKGDTMGKLAFRRLVVLFLGALMRTAGKGGIVAKKFYERTGHDFKGWT
jgi:hypothetical protein